ncbi:MAG TPA: hypothetical protein VMB34_15785 [Acetobacteraceae bacterium]|nr:hypothetical protein [Acetobacteraceae bacterium]
MPPSLQIAARVADGEVDYGSFPLPFGAARPDGRGAGKGYAGL